jgi:hypothetical protein
MDRSNDNIPSTLGGPENEGVKMTGHHLIYVFSLTISLLLFQVGLNTSSLRAEITADQVNDAMEKGIKYLTQQQNPNGSWSEWPVQPGGMTSLCTLALLNAGLEPDDPQIQKSLEYLRKIKPAMNYSTALQTMVFCRADPEKDRLLIIRNVKWLEETQVMEGPRKGAWSYPSGAGDNSNAQFALLALHEAERVGVRAKDSTWRLALRYWEECQNGDGSWGYYQGQSGTGSMTSAGITSLVIAADRIQPPDAKVTGNEIKCCVTGENTETDRRINNGIDWIGRNFTIADNPGASGHSWNLYFLYGLERAGRLTARRFIGEHDWYREGADHLVRRQDGFSGFWVGRGAGEDNPLVGTSFALLFLSKGRWPILLSKIKHEPKNDWNQHRHDAHNLTRFVESRWKQDLTWQVTDIDRASVEDLLQSPVLYFCGSASPIPDDAARRQKMAVKLRDYLDRGGFLFAEAYCGDAGFDKGFRELMAMVFPEKEYKLQLIEAEHPIWHYEIPVKSDYVRPLYGIEYGCRTSVIYAPLDPEEHPRPSLSCLWELSHSGRGEKYSESVQAQIDAGMAIGINVLAYATNRELKKKTELWTDIPKRKPGERSEPGRIYIAKLKHPGGCNAAPRALVNLLDSADRELKIRATAEDDLISITDDALFDYHLVFMHGRNGFHLIDEERKHLKAYLERGGMLFADSICASKAFSESFRAEMAAIFPDKKLERIPPDDPMFTKKYGGFDLREVSRRDPQTRAADSPVAAAVKKVPPELEGIKIDDRWAVVFSPYDLSCALEKRDTLECRGYIREDAARIGLNVILYSLQH